jgi:hypothetical protein
MFSLLSAAETQSQLFPHTLDGPQRLSGEAVEKEYTVTIPHKAEALQVGSGKFSIIPLSFTPKYGP